MSSSSGEAMSNPSRAPPTMKAAPFQPGASEIPPLASVTVVLHNRSVLSVEDQAWLALVGHMAQTPRVRRMLVLARHEGS
jgi:hypothetical protein